MFLARRTAAAILAAAALGLAACGDDEDSGGDQGATPPAAETQQTEAAPPAETEAETTETEAGGDDVAAQGKQVFTSNGCAGCHTLADAGASGTQGPNLDEAKPDAEAVATKVREGGGGMPSFEGQLDDAEIEAVAQYVSSVAGG